MKRPANPANHRCVIYYQLARSSVELHATVQAKDEGEAIAIAWARYLRPYKARRARKWHISAKAGRL